MQVLTVRNVHQALSEGLYLLSTKGNRRKSRYGEVLVMNEPVTTRYKNPWERVVFWEERDANPFFHLFESLWMLAGRNDVDFLKRFTKRMETFSDDGKTLHGAYGKRWRTWFKFDQLEEIIKRLKKSPDDRRCVLQMWDSTEDLRREGKDLPCNTQIYFTISCDGRLDMSVCCRSNDIIWGAYGANAVHFSILQEYIAKALDLQMGHYWQISNNYHAYLDTFDPISNLQIHARDPYRTIPRCPYQRGEVLPTLILDVDAKTWMEDLEIWMDDPVKVGLRSQFFRRVATPLYMAHQAYKNKDPDHAISIINEQMMTGFGDWKIASIEWIQRRMKNAKS
jgi:thymidylate synthase